MICEFCIKLLLTVSYIWVLCADVQNVHDKYYVNTQILALPKLESVNCWACFYLHYWIFTE